MLNRLALASGLAALALPCNPLFAAEPTDDTVEIRNQINRLQARLDKLEQENTQLKANNSSAGASSKKLPEWLDRIGVSGDLRYRVERTDDSTETDKRQRDRIRARLAVTGKVNDVIGAGVQLTTSEGGDPRAGNQTLDGENSRKPVYFDLAYIDWAALPTLHVIGGKMKAPFFRPGQSLFFDNDINPEGVTITYSKDQWFASAHGLWIDENVVNTGTTTGAADTVQYGGQIGGNFAFGDTKLTVAAMYTDLASAQGRRPFFSNTATGSNGNTVTGTGTAAVLTYDFRIVELATQWTAKLGALPLQVWADVAQNRDPDTNRTAWTLGMMLGKAAAPKSWEAGISVLKFEKDALFGQYVDSDFGGVTDSKSTVLRIGYAPFKNTTLCGSYFMTKRNVEVGTETDLDRLLIDLMVKF